MSDQIRTDYPGAIPWNEPRSDTCVQMSNLCIRCDELWPCRAVLLDALSAAQAEIQRLTDERDQHLASITEGLEDAAESLRSHMLKYADWEGRLAAALDVIGNLRVLLAPPAEPVLPPHESFATEIEITEVREGAVEE